MAVPKGARREPRPGAEKPPETFVLLAGLLVSARAVGIRDVLGVVNDLPEDPCGLEKDRVERGCCVNVRCAGTCDVNARLGVVLEGKVLEKPVVVRLPVDVPKLRGVGVTER